MTGFLGIEPGLAIQLTLVVPALGTLLIIAAGRWPNLRDTVMVITAATMFLMVLQVLPSVLQGERPGVNLFEFFPGLNVAFEAEPLGMVFALVASGLWVLTALYGIGYMRGAGEKHQTRFYACFAVALFSAAGIAFAQNMLTLFLFYELLTLSTYPLVAHKGTDAAKRGARTYLSLLLGTSIGFQLVAIISTWWLTGSLDFTDGGIMEGRVGHGVGAILLLLYMYGIGKAALMPFHRWLPAAMVAPTPVSALLHAVAVVKAGVFTVLKVATYLFGLDYLGELWSTEVVMYIATFTLLAASLVAIQKDNLKARLAYSTVSQLSYIVVAAMLVSQIATVGGGMHILMHAFGKITLFFCAGAIYVASKKTEISDMDGIGRRMPFTLLAFFLGALSVIGLPPAGGTWSKLYLAMGAFDTGHWIVVAALMISSLLNIAYLLPLVVRGFLLPPRDGYQGGIKEAPLFCVVPLSLTALGCLVLFFQADAVAGLLQGLWDYR